MLILVVIVKTGAHATFGRPCLSQLEAGSQKRPFPDAQAISWGPFNTTVPGCFILFFLLNDIQRDSTLNLAANLSH